ncbi:hypothetical protein [Actomonas aquatica]|uniref:DUF2946 domain-containing protein n=1 Tax=Actomonas aquatica TaxID=2866162 RepID=A0ABZ1C554_9BACT|nr:hypothetical protein [Opitutus sp. WL0086]WRQ86861.1 hypothetical protein K1X11_018775 [Opitutus sp. WL0086]
MFISAHYRKAQPRRRVLAVLLAWTVFALGVLTVAPELHVVVHDDAHSPEHSCAVDLFAGGVTPALTVVLFAPVALLALGSITPVTRVAQPTPTWSLPPGRAPPQM